MIIFAKKSTIMHLDKKSSFINIINQTQKQIQLTNTIAVNFLVAFLIYGCSNKSKRYIQPSKLPSWLKA
jgi:hypothetical protein